MFVTVTLNAAFDHILHLPKLFLGEVNRVQFTQRMLGGKGVNVACALATLGEEVVATGFLGGESSRPFEATLRKIGVTTNFVYIDQDIRTDFYVIEEGKNVQTMIIEEGTPIKEHYLNNFKANFKRLLSTVKVVEIGGSLPEGVKPSFIGELVSMAAAKKVKVILNQQEAIIKECLGKEELFIVSPDLRGCKDIFCRDIKKAENRKQIVQEILGRNVEMVVFNFDRFKYLAARKGELWEGEIEEDEKRPLIMIGTRDGMLAGFMHKYLSGQSIEEALKYGLAAALSTARHKLNYPASKEEVEKLIAKAKVKKVD